MEEEKLLRSLIIILSLLTFCTSSSTFACCANKDKEKSDMDFAMNLTKDAKQVVIEQSKAELKSFLAENPLAAKDLDLDISKNDKPRLLVFVSTSMPFPLLQSYFKEAAKYKGALVFKGLPNGSFKELTNLILKLEEKADRSSTRGASSEENKASAMIDDESFKRFGVESVPSIVLVKEEECFEMSSCKVSYDKVGGNIGILGALRQFAEEGDLKNEAHNILQNEAVR